MKYRRVKNWNGVEGLVKRGVLPNENENFIGRGLFFMGMDAYAAGELETDGWFGKEPNEHWLNGWKAAQRAKEAEA